jgi:hypothetical protein
VPHLEQGLNFFVHVMKRIISESLDGFSFRGFVKYCLVQLCIICRKIKVNKHCEIFYFSFGCLKGCSGYFSYVLESQMRGDEVQNRIAENAECRRMMCCSLYSISGIVTTNRWSNSLSLLAWK